METEATERPMSRVPRHRLIGQDVSDIAVILPPTDEEKIHLPKMAPPAFDVSHIDPTEALLKL